MGLGKRHRAAVDFHDVEIRASVEKAPGLLRPKQSVGEVLAGAHDGAIAWGTASGGRYRVAVGVARRIRDLDLGEIFVERMLASRFQVAKQSFKARLVAFRIAGRATEAPIAPQLRLGRVDF